MRNLVIERLTAFIRDSDGYGIPRGFDFEEEDNITDPEELKTMSDVELLDTYESTVGFLG